MYRKAIAILLLIAPVLPVHAAEQETSDYLQRAIQYENGRGVAKDLHKAYRLYCLAAQEKNADAYYHLGWIHLHGRGVINDKGIAVGWFAKGAKAGDKVASYIVERLADVEAKKDPNCPEVDPKHLTRPAIEKLVRMLAPEYGLDPALVLAVITAESSFRANVRSHKGAHGLMQLIPATAKRFGVRNIKDPVQNLRGGMAYLQWLSKRFDGDVSLMLAAYNAGENAVKRHQGIPPYRETQRYVKRITRHYRDSLLSAAQANSDDTRTL